MYIFSLSRSDECHTTVNVSQHSLSTLAVFCFGDLVSAPTHFLAHANLCESGSTLAPVRSDEQHHDVIMLGSHPNVVTGVLSLHASALLQVQHFASANP
jgi:hypothetical protein